MTSTVQATASCPASTQNCIPCQCAEQYCRCEEGATTGYLGWACQNNNPSNIRYSSYRIGIIEQMGGTAPCGEKGGFMVFSTYDIGYNSVKAYIRGINAGLHSSYPECGTINSCSLLYFFTRYAPNDPAAYTDGVVEKMGGLTPGADVFVALSNTSSFTGTGVRWHDWFAPENEIPATGNFDGDVDGRTDIITFTHDNRADVYVALSNGSNEFIGTSQKWHDYFAPGHETPLTGDFNSDGKDDIVTFTSNASADVWVALSKGNSFGAGVKWHDWFAPYDEIPQVGDVNGDGKVDIVTFTSDASGDVWIALSTGTSFGTGRKWHDYFAPGDEIPLTGDFNGDGKDDIVTFTSDSKGDVWVALSTGNSFSTGVKWHDWFAPNEEIPQVGDVNGDGLDDIITFTSDSSGDVWIALSTGSSFGTGRKWHDYFAPDKEVPAIGDVNGDGVDDIITFTNNTLLPISPQTDLSSIVNARFDDLINAIQQMEGFFTQ